MRQPNDKERAKLVERYAAVLAARKSLAEAEHLFHRAVAWARELCDLPPDEAIAMVADEGMLWSRRDTQGTWRPLECEDSQP